MSLPTGCHSADSSLQEELLHLLKIHVRFPRGRGHDSGSGWIATPFLCDSFIRDSTPDYPGAHHGLLARTLAAMWRRNRGLRALLGEARCPKVNRLRQIGSAMVHLSRMRGHLTRTFRNGILDNRFEWIPDWSVRQWFRTYLRQVSHAKAYAPDRSPFAGGADGVSGVGCAAHYRYLDLPSGFSFTLSGVCSFDVFEELLGNKEQIATFYDQNGDISFQLLTGVNKWRFANMDTGKSIVVNGSGPGRFAVQPGIDIVPAETGGVSLWTFSTPVSSHPAGLRLR